MSRLLRISWRLPLWVEIAATILIALGASNIATAVYFRIDGESRWRRFGDEVLADRIASIANLILGTSADARPALLATLSKSDQRFTIDTTPLVSGSSRDEALEARIAAKLAQPAEVRVQSETPDVQPRATVENDWGRSPDTDEPRQRRQFVVSVASGGTWLNVRATMPAPPAIRWPSLLLGGQIAERTGLRYLPPLHQRNAAVGAGVPHPGGSSVAPPPPGRPVPGPAFVWPPLLSAGAAVAALLLAALWLGRRVALPLQRLAEASRAMRSGEPPPIIPETGPSAVRDATRAFNGMSQRLTATLESQRAMMAAVAHDLRTPIASLRLRAEFVADEEVKTRLLETVAEMQAMTEAVLDGVSGERGGERARPVDVRALAESLVADMAEIGGDVSFDAPGPAVRCVCRPGEVRRALRNLIENALRYGETARVSLDVRGDMVEFHVADQGPGVPEGDLARMFEPFARLEQSRSRETGGYGLGLPIARLIARSHGGDVTLANRPEGGLTATLTLPLK